MLTGIRFGRALSAPAGIANPLVDMGLIIVRRLIGALTMFPLRSNAMQGRSCFYYSVTLSFL